MSSPTCPTCIVQTAGAPRTKRQRSHSSGRRSTKASSPGGPFAYLRRRMKTANKEPPSSHSTRRRSTKASSSDGPLAYLRQRVKALNKKPRKTKREFTNRMQTEFPDAHIHTKDSPKAAIRKALKRRKKSMGSSNTSSRSEVQVWATGSNLSGQLGLGNWTSTPVPKSSVTALNSPVRAVACGEDHTMFLREDGSVWATGYNLYGQLGLGHKTDQNTPVEVTAVGKTVQVVSCGAYHTMFLREDGSVWATGENKYGQLGLGHTTEQNTPVEVTAVGKSVRAVACGYEYTMFVRDDGSVWATGENNFGQLGLGHKMVQSTPVEVTGLEKDVQAVVCGTHHTMFLRENGSVWATGKNRNGLFGIGKEYVDQVTKTPIEVKKTVKAVECGYGHTMFLK